MTGFGVGFLVGAAAVAILGGVLQFILNRRGAPQFEELEVPEKPEPTLTEEEKERIREEISSDTNAALSRRFLELLSRRRDSHGRGGKNSLDHS